MILQIKTQRADPSVEPPVKAHATDAAFDLCSAERVVLAPGDRALIRTGLVVAIPEGYCGLILPRSGLAIKHGITVINAPGLIDSGFRGEVQVGLVHLGLRQRRTERTGHYHSYRIEPYYNIAPGDRIAQLLIVKAMNAQFVNAIELDSTDRGGNGFGSTGV